MWLRFFWSNTKVIQKLFYVCGWWFSRFRRAYIQKYHFHEVVLSIGAKLTLHWIGKWLYLYKTAYISLSLSIRSCICHIKYGIICRYILVCRIIFAVLLTFFISFLKKNCTCNTIFHFFVNNFIFNLTNCFEMIYVYFQSSFFFYIYIFFTIFPSFQM